MMPNTPRRFVRLCQVVALNLVLCGVCPVLSAQTQFWTAPRPGDYAEYSASYARGEIPRSPYMSPQTRPQRSFFSWGGAAQADAQAEAVPQDARQYAYGGWGAAPRFSAYANTGYEYSGPQRELAPEDYITPPPPGLVPVDYPIELFLSRGYGRFGDMTFPILGGERGAPTPTGRFTLQRKELAYMSKKYKTPMPYSLFFTDAHAIHYGALDVPSRGCVHVDYRTAQILYYSTITGKTRVIIHP